MLEVGKGHEFLNLAQPVTFDSLCCEGVECYMASGLDAFLKGISNMHGMYWEVARNNIVVFENNAA